MAVELAQINGSDNRAGRTVERQPGQASSDSRANRRIEPQRAAAGLARIPYFYDLVRLSRGFALGFRTLRLLSGSGGGSLAFLCSSVDSHLGRLLGLPLSSQAIISAS